MSFLIILSTISDCMSNSVLSQMEKMRAYIGIDIRHQPELLGKYWHNGYQQKIQYHESPEISILLHRLHSSICWSLWRGFRSGTKFCYALTSIDSQSECITELRPETNNVHCPCITIVTVRGRMKMRMRRKIDRLIYQHAYTKYSLTWWWW